MVTCFGSILLMMVQSRGCNMLQRRHSRNEMNELGTLLGCVIYVICVFFHLVVLVKLSVPVQVIDWKDSSPK